MGVLLFIDAQFGEHEFGLKDICCILHSFFARRTYFVVILDTHPHPHFLVLVVFAFLATRSYLAPWQEAHSFAGHGLSLTAQTTLGQTGADSIEGIDAYSWLPHADRCV